MEQTAPLRTRTAGVEDAEFLVSMLVHAVNWNPHRGEQSREDVLSTPALAHYVDGWPRPGDVGVVAIDEAGEKAGAAWLRQFTADDPSYGYVDDRTPELSVGVRAGHRGRGVGTALCRELLRSADDAGIPRISLSVEKANPAMALYSRLGFVVIRDDGGAVTMLRARHRSLSTPGWFDRRLASLELSEKRGFERVERDARTIGDVAELVHRPHPFVGREDQQVQQRGWIPAVQDEALEAGAVSSPALRDAEDLAAVDRDFTGSDGAETDESTPGGVLERSAMHDAADPESS